MEPLFWPRSGQKPIRNLRRQLKHTQLFWREIGRGQTVVFLHGAWQDGDQWRDVIAQLGSHYHCLAPDLVGFGESDRLTDKSAYSIAIQANTLQELLESLRLTSVVLVGHSLGAWVAARYALQNPDRVQGLCVLEPEGVVYDPKRWKRERWLASPLGGLWLAITRLFARKSPRRTTWLQNHHLRTLLKQHPAACRMLFKRRRNALESELIGSQLAALSIPIVAIQGEQSSATSQKLMQTFTTAVPRTYLQVLPGQDDLPNHRADAIAAFLKDWLSPNRS